MSTWVVVWLSVPRVHPSSCPKLSTSPMQRKSSVENGWIGGWIIIMLRTSGLCCFFSPKCLKRAKYWSTKWSGLKMYFSHMPYIVSLRPHFWLNGHLAHLKEEKHFFVIYGGTHKAWVQSLSFLTLWPVFCSRRCNPMWKIPASTTSSRTKGSRWDSICLPPWEAKPAASAPASHPNTACHPGSAAVPPTVPWLISPSPRTVRKRYFITFGWLDSVFFLS